MSQKDLRAKYKALPNIGKLVWRKLAQDKWTAVLYVPSDEKYDLIAVVRKVDSGNPSKRESDPLPGLSYAPGIDREEEERKQRNAPRFFFIWSIYKVPKGGSVPNPNSSLATLLMSRSVNMESEAKNQVYDKMREIHRTRARMEKRL